DPDMAAAHLQLQVAVAALEQALQFLHALARDDDLALVLHRRFQRGVAQGQTVAIGGHAAQAGVGQVEQQAVEVVAHVLLGHGEGGALDQLLERGLGHADALGRLDLVDRREIVRRQARQGEAAAPGLDGDLVPGLGDGDLAAVGQGANDVEQLARGDGGLAILGIVHRAARDHLHFQVGAGQRQLSSRDLGEQVGQHGQGLPAFDDVDHLRERLQEGFALQAETHAWASCGKASRKLESTSKAVWLGGLHKGYRYRNPLFYLTYSGAAGCGQLLRRLVGKLWMIPSRDIYPQLVPLLSPHTTTSSVAKGFRSRAGPASRGGGSFRPVVPGRDWAPSGIRSRCAWPCGRRFRRRRGPRVPGGGTTPGRATWNRWISCRNLAWTEPGRGSRPARPCAGETSCRATPRRG